MWLSGRAPGCGPGGRGFDPRHPPQMYNPLFRYILNNQVIMALLIIAGVFLLVEIKEILVLIFIAYIIAASLYPAVSFLRIRRVPNALAVLIPYLLVLSFILLLIVPLLPFFISQAESLIEKFPLYFRDATATLGINFTIPDVKSLINPSSFGDIGRNAILITTKLFGGLFSILAIFILGLYMLLDHDKLQRFPIYFFPRKMEEKVLKTEQLVEDKLGAWLRGQIILSFTIGLITWIFLTALKVEFALPLALLAGFLEIIPTLGPLLSAVPAVIVGLAISPAMAATIALGYTTIQLAENHLLVPKIMQRAVGLNPVVIIAAILIGGKLMGVLGALLSIPLLSVLVIIYRQIRHLS
ncbi:MAG: hypothetical protein US77_C0022G0010 [Microgenomates group bacterium GW2011_GWC1_38_14]|nr:MAG: hypothetical protein US77_C0022G0010 [Microgenomates group bacterium GW2011_GWC1_38_14]